MTDAFTEANAREYFDCLAQKIICEDLTQIFFKQSNDFFLPDLQRGVDPFNCNKMDSGFSYRLKLPALAESSNKEKLKAKVNVLNTTALRIQPFKSGNQSLTA